MSTTLTPTLTNGRELSRLLTAAVVNQRFCKMLLTNPASALAAGYNGEAFRLGKEDRDLILSIRAKSLPDFATQLTGNRFQNYRANRPAGPMLFST